MNILEAKQEHEAAYEENKKIWSMCSFDSNDCWLLKLPRHIQDNILRRLFKLDAIYLAYSVPQFLEITSQPKHWKVLKHQINSKYITKEELFEIFEYVNDHLRQVSIDLDSYENLDLNKLFNEIPYLTSLKIKFSLEKYPNIFDIILLHLGHLKEINVKCNDFDSEHLKRIVDKYPNLNSIVLHTDLNIDCGLFYAVKKLKVIKNFDIAALSISQE